MSNRIGFPSFCNMLTEADLDKIHEASIKILAEIGVDPNSEKVKDVYTKNGCAVDEKTGNILFTREIVEKYMAMLPPKFTFYARNPKYDVTLPDDGPIFTSSGSVSKINDLETGEVRDTVTSDISRLSALTSKMDGYGIFFGGMIPTEVPSDDVAITRAYASIRYTEKHIRLGGIHSPEEADKLVKLGSAVMGSKEAYTERPFMLCHNTPLISPLKMDTKSAEMLIYFTENKMPTYFSILPNGGMTSPMSLSGTLAQVNAEFIAVSVLVQMVREGTPVIYSTLPTIADMRTGAYASAGIEAPLMMMATSQMARRYNVPSASLAGLTNSNSMDAQAGYEKALSPLACIVAGSSFIKIGGLLGGLSTYDECMYVVDNDIARMIKRLQQGIDFENDDIDDAIDAIKEVGTGGMFLQHEHTFLNCHNIPFFPEIADRDSRGIWEGKGKPDIKVKAKAKIKQWLSEPYEQELSAEAQARVREEFPELPSCDITIPEL